MSVRSAWFIFPVCISGALLVPGESKAAERSATLTVTAVVEPACAAHANPHAWMYSAPLVADTRSAAQVNCSLPVPYQVVLGTTFGAGADTHARSDGGVETIDLDPQVRDALLAPGNEYFPGSVVREMLGHLNYRGVAFSELYPGCRYESLDESRTGAMTITIIY